MRPRTLAVAAFAHVLALPLLGCSSRCTAAACNPSATLLFPRAVAAAGNYVVHIKGDDKSAECSLTVAAESRVGETASCDDPIVDWSVTSPPSQSTSNTENIYIEGLRWHGQPETLSFELSRDGVVILSRIVTPLYANEEPNGPGCGVCPTARMNIEKENQ